MNEIEKYEFDRKGYIIIRKLLKKVQVKNLLSSINLLEKHAIQNLKKPPRKMSPWGPEYHFNERKGYHAQGENKNGGSIIIEDFWNADSTFDCLINHGPTMKYINAIIQTRPTINNSEIRIRYNQNNTNSHGGNILGRSSHLSSQKYKYSFGEHGIDCMMVRMIYFVHDCRNDQGAFCVSPATHKSNLPSPYNNNPDTDPSMVGLEVEAGDAILFTESLRHGGFSNHSKQPRKTIHVGYGPHWMMSQNMATMDEKPFILPETFARLSEEQSLFFRPW